MSGTFNILVILAVTVLVIARQLRARQLDSEKRVWLIPLILAVLSLRDPALVDPHHQLAAICLIAVGVLVEIALGSAWAWTSRLWQESDGAVWVKGTPAALAAWLGMMVVRGGLYGVGTALGVKQGTSDLLLALAALLLVRGLVLRWRADRLVASYRVPTLID
ncbi:hypothetical protein CFP65_5263 [Kitasatospora sp. MMS16-BH015]|uniref:CcdC protein domain-containing protein n=1 Tax=Kitasatospora sp. MMS16-BH015 TaxID=2018025 RepID=UPI000CA120A0|nr:CcdC protein domain-containing protein [Kitasatospora sp. MMS16-BH015]AUG79972.1 hypothetical protein CFP65_5263 [Kitasatospora sp. MMS16-BH015]